MRTARLGALEVSRIGLRVMGMSHGYTGAGSDDAESTNNPRFTGENFQRCLRIADEVQAVAAEVDATPAQVALARLAHQWRHRPHPRHQCVSRVEENTAADAVQLTAEQIATLDSLSPAEAATTPRPRWR